jgi:DNA polymerase III subunit delta
LAPVAAALKPLYLIAGTDRPKIRVAVARLRNRFDEGAVEVRHAADVTGEDAVAACNALGLFGGEARLVVVEDVEQWKAPDVKAVAEYAKDPAPQTVLALVGAAMKKEAALSKAVGKAGELLIYDAPRKRDLPAWIAKQFEQLGVSADRDACKRLLDVVGDDPELLRAEVEKLVTWSSGEPVNAVDVEQVAAPSAETSVFEVTDAWGRRDVGAVLAATESLLERTGARELPRLTALLASHVSRVRVCQSLAAEGVRPRDAASRLKLHPFAAEKAFAHAANFAPDELAEATIRLAALDHALKGGSRLAPELELEQTLVEITRPAGARVAQR